MSVKSGETLPPENLHSPGGPWCKALLRFLALGDPQGQLRVSSQRSHFHPRGPGLRSKERDLVESVGKACCTGWVPFQGQACHE